MAEIVSAPQTNITGQVDSCPSFSFLGGPETIFDILFHIVILSFILEVVFELKLADLEKNEIRSKVDEALRTTLGQALSNTNVYLPPQLFTALAAWFSSDEEHKTINKLVVSRNRMLIGMLALACAGFFVTISFTCKAKHSRKALFNTLMNNAFLLLVVGVIEGIFVFKIILKYVPTKPSLLQQTVVDRLKHVAAVAEKDGECKDITKPCGSQLPFAVRIGGFTIVIMMLIALTRFYKPKSHGFSAANVMWQGVMVSGVISGLFLTLGTTQEVIVMQNVLERIVDSYSVSLYKSVKAISPKAADDIVEYFDSLDDNSNQDTSADLQVEEANAKLRSLAFVIVGCTFVVATVVTIIERIVVNRRAAAGDRHAINEKPSNIVFAALIAACCSFIAEFNFMVNVAAETRPLSVEQVNRSALSMIQRHFTNRVASTDDVSEEDVE